MPQSRIRRVDGAGASSVATWWGGLFARGLGFSAVSGRRRVVGVVVLSVLWTLVGGPVPTASGAPVLPAGFALRDMPTGQSELLTDFAWTPDGGYFTTGKNGRVAWVSAAGASRTVALLPVVSSGDSGLVGVAVAPDYATSRTVYTARTVSVAGAGRLRAEAWTVTVGGAGEPVGLADARIVVDLPAGSTSHALTTILPAADGSLWISIGDSSDFARVDPLALRVQDLDQGYGKLLHMFPDGRGVPSNPFYDPADPTSWRSRVYAYGFRSPFRFSLDPGSGVPVLGDVGWTTSEEVDLVQPGANYGWPCWEGDDRTPGYRDLDGCVGVPNTAPLWAYRHGTQGTTVVGGVVYTGSAYPEAYRGAYFFGDYTAERLYTLRFDAAGRLTRAPEAAGFGDDIGAPVKFDTAPNGDVVFADIASASMRRLVYAAGNRPPTARGVTGTDPGTRTVTFDASESYDLDGDPLTYTWDFGDGSTGAGRVVSHQYAAPGTDPVTATLTVRDPFGGTGTATFTVVPANAPPVLTLVAPPEGTVYRVGDPVGLSATAEDPEDGPLTVVWTTTLVHCAPYCHDHPGVSVTGPAYTQVFADHGDDTRLLITATATDSAGVAASRSHTAMPKLRVLTVAPNRPAAVTINASARTSAEVTVGATVSVVAPAAATFAVATFEGWDDGAPRTREFVVPDADVTLGVAYLTPMDRRYRDDAAFRALLRAPVDGEGGDAALTLRNFQGGRAYWTPASGVHEVHGAIRSNYLAAGGHQGFGEPVTDERATADGVGRYNNFRLGASSYWTPGTGAHMVYGAIRSKWLALGAERGPNRYPVTDEATTGSGRGRYNNFQNGAVYWTGSTGARSMYGAIWSKYGTLGWDRGFLGFPVTDETGTPDGVGRFNHMEGGSLYWSPGSGAHEVHGAIRSRWAARGWERSYLGYPTSDEFSVPGGRRSNFQHGYIVWNASTGAVTDTRT